MLMMLTIIIAVRIRMELLGWRASRGLFLYLLVDNATTILSAETREVFYHPILVLESEIVIRLRVRVYETNIGATSFELRLTTLLEGAESFVETGESIIYLVQLEVVHPT